MRTPRIAGPLGGKRVLVLDAFTRKALSVVRSLGREGVLVDVVTHKRFAASARSSYVRGRFVVEKPQTDVARYAERIVDILRAGAYDAVFPLEDASCAALLAHRGEVEAHAALPLAPADRFAVANDKWSTMELAQAAGVPHPRSVRPTEDELAAVARDLRFPLVVKPVSSSGSRGLHVVHDAAALAAAYHAVTSRYGAPLVQEALPWRGEGIGVGVLADRGELRVAFTYRRLREFPVRGGPSTLRESTDDARLRDYARTMVRALGWHGVAMLEFKRDAHGDPQLLEINPRFWGSLALADAAGVNFPALLLRLACGLPVEQPVYAVGTRTRWLLPGDVAHFIANPDRFRMQPSFFRFFDSGTNYDEFAADDVRGSVMSVVETVASVFDAETWRLGIFRR